jgi:VanZ family protein
VALLSRDAHAIFCHRGKAWGGGVPRLAKILGWILLLAIAALSVVPPTLRPVTILPHDFEHAAIFFLAGCAFGLGYKNGFLAWLLGLSTFTLAIEITQRWIPGRHARGLDFFVDVFSIGVGLAVGAMVARRSLRLRPIRLRV